MRNRIKILLLFLITLSIPGLSIYAQEIKANVIVNMEQLPQDVRQYVSTLDQDLKRYINSQQFTNIEWKEDQIPVEIVIYLSGGANYRYSAKVFIVAKRKLVGGTDDAGMSILAKMRDDKWSFVYNMGASLSYNTLRFDEFTSLVDYYMLLIIGMDRDLYTELDGSAIYDKAKNIVMLGNSKGSEGYSTSNPQGDFTRYNLANELTDLRYEDLRKIFFSYYFDGLDKMATNKDEALKSLADNVYQMALFKQNKMFGSSVLMQLFFDTKAQELATLFKDYPEKAEVYKNLIYLDPGDTMLFEAARDGK